MSLRIRESGNDELVNHLIRRNLIHSAQVERVHRAVDRAKYVSPLDRDQAYVMRPWRRGPLHLSSPCIYGPVLEGLELKPGLSFLNVGSGTGYLSTMVGLILGSSGINHGVEVEPSAVEYANNILEQFIESSPILDEIDFCDTKFYNGNGLCLSREQALYDRLYCGTECSTEQLEYFKRLIRIGGVLVLPVHNVLVQVKRTSVDRWASRNLISVIFAKLKLPTTDEAANPFEIEVSLPPRLKILCYVKVRERLRTSLRAQQKLLRGPLIRRPPSNNTDVDALLRLLLKKNQNPCRTDCGTIVNQSLDLTTTPKLTGQEGIISSGNRLFLLKKDSMVYDDSDVENSEDDELPSASTTDEEEDDSERVPRLSDSTDSFKNSSFIDSTSSSARSSPSPSVYAFFARCLEQTNNTEIIQSDARNTSTEKKPNSDRTYQSSSFNDSTSSFIYPESATTLANPFISFLEQTKNARRIQSDASDTSDDNDTDNIKESKKERIIATGAFRSINEVTDESNRQSKDDEISTENDVKLKRTPLLFDVSLLRPFTKTKNVSSRQSSSEGEIESIDDATKSKRKGLLFDTAREIENEVNEQTDLSEKLDSGIDELSTTSVQCSKDEQIDGLTSSDCARDDVELVNTFGQQVAKYDRLILLKSPADINKHNDVAEVESSSKHDMFYRWTQQSDFTENNVAPGVYTRLNIADCISSIPLGSSVHPVTVPVSFKTLPEYIDKIWDTMQSFKSRSFGQLDNDTNKAIFKKGALLLAEAKVAYGQRTTSATPDEYLPTSKAYNNEELSVLNQMAAKLPLPIALYLECLGTTKDCDQVITPVIAEYAQDVKLSGAMTYAPIQLVTLLQLLREGVPLMGAVHQLCLKELDGLPMILWENFCSPGVPPLTFGQLMVRLTEESYNFWITMRSGFPTIKWEQSDHNLFERIVNSFILQKGFNVEVDLSHGEGTLAQVVQTVDWSINASTRWFTKIFVTDDLIKLGVAFGFSRFCDVQSSRFTGTLGTAYMRGETTPFRIMSAILHKL